MNYVHVYPEMITVWNKHTKEIVPFIYRDDGTIQITSMHEGTEDDYIVSVLYEHQIDGVNRRVLI